jgi:hypothetical protein
MQSVPSTAVQIVVTVIPIVGIVMGSIVIFFFLLWNHKQKILMIEKGVFKKSDFDVDTFSLFSGLILSCIGIGLLVFFYIKEGINYSILSGLIPFSVGISLIIFFVLHIKIFTNSNER